MKYLPKRYIFLNDSIMFLHAFYMRLVPLFVSVLCVRAFKKQFWNNKNFPKECSKMLIIDCLN